MSEAACCALNPLVRISVRGPWNANIPPGMDALEKLDELLHRQDPIVFTTPHRFRSPRNYRTPEVRY